MQSKDIASFADKLRLKGDPEQAGKLARQALEIDDDTSGLGWHIAYRCLGKLAWDKANLCEARRWYEQALVHRRNQPHVSIPGLIAALDDLAVVEYYRGQETEALEHRREALNLAEGHSCSDPAELRRLRRRLAQSLHALSYIGDAEAVFRQCSPDVDDSVEDKIGWLNAMALVSEDKGDFADSVRWFDELIDLLDMTDDAEGLAAALGNAIQTRLELGHIREATAQLARLRRVCRTDKKLASWLALDAVRMVHLMGRGRYAAALRVVNGSERRVTLSLPDDPVPLRFTVLKCMLLRKIGRLREAGDLASTHLTSANIDDDDHVALLVEHAHACFQYGGLVQAREQLTHAIGLDAGRQKGERKWLILSLFADVAAALSRPRAAILLGKMAIMQLRHTSRGLAGAELEGWLRPRMEAYMKILNALTAAGRDPEAVRLQLDRPSEMRLEEVMFRNSPAERSCAIYFRPGEAEIWSRYLAICETWRPQFLKGENDAVAVRNYAEVEALISDIFDEKFDLSPQGNQTVPDMPEAGPYPLLTYLPSRDTLRGILILNGETILFDVPARIDDIASSIRTLRQSLQNQDAEWPASSQFLYDTLIAPIAGALKTEPRIDILASGMISCVPFAALHDGERFWVENVAVAFRSGRGRTTTRGSAHCTWSASAFAPVAADIPGAFMEAGDLAGQSGGQFSAGAAFTLDNVKMALKRGDNLLHLATHFVHEPTHPHRSRMLLGGNRWVGLSELAASDLNMTSVELLVLSGCDTGMTDGVDLGVEGLAGLMQSRGARTVLATLWKVDDKAARQLMAEFYRILFSERSVDPIRALADAQVASVKESREELRCNGQVKGIGQSGHVAHPGGWAGFVAFVP